MGARRPVASRTNRREETGTVARGDYGGGAVWMRMVRPGGLVTEAESVGVVAKACDFLFKLKSSERI
jgi:hypothetical protein